jgi:hypothetical protein
VFRRRKAQRADPWLEYERLSALDPATLSPAQVQFVALGGLRTEINNGGFHQYFFNTAGDLANEAIEAAERVAAPELADLLRRAAALLTVTEMSDRDARQDALEGIDPDEFESLDDEYLALEQSRDLDELMRAVID